MINQNLAIKIKDLRNRKGFSQEQLAEESKLSLKTVQRIEEGESIPREDTLVKLTQALDVTPDDILEWGIIKNKGYLQLLNLSSICFIIQPFLGIIIPLVMWVLKRGKVKSIDAAGKKLINFQITWTLTVYLYIIMAILLTGRSLFYPGGRFAIPFNFNIIHVLSDFRYSFSFFTTILFSLYLFNIISIILNVRKSQKGLSNTYVLSIQFLK